MSEAFINSNEQSFNAEPPSAEPIASAIVKPMTWIETFGGILVAPVQTMRNLAFLNDDNVVGITGVGGAALAVLIPFALEGIRSTPADSLGFAWLNVPFSMVLGMMLWLTLAGFYSLTASIFGAPANRCRRSFVLIGWSFAPWILTAPIYCYRELLGPAFVLVAAIPFVWTFILQMIAVRTSFELKSAQMLALFFIVPVLYQAQQMMQFAQGVFVSVSSLM